MHVVLVAVLLHLWVLDIDVIVGSCVLLVLVFLFVSVRTCTDKDADDVVYLVYVVAMLLSLLMVDD